MSKIQNLPQSVLDAITPYLLTGEVIDKALLQDNKKPREIWLIKTNQAIILHGQQPDKPQPAIMVMALDEIREIDYLQKPDDNQIILYSSKNNGKAVFHFEISASKEIEKFLEDLGDLITFRYQTEKGKITVVQKALPIGSKERKIFGRGKQQNVPFLTKNKPSNVPTKEPAPKQSEKLSVKVAPKAEPQPVSKENTKTVSTKAKPDNTPSAPLKQEPKKASTAISEPLKAKDLPKETPKDSPSKPKEDKAVTPVSPNSNKENKPAETKSSKAVNSAIISHLQESPVKKPSKEIDYGNPLFFITVTIIATITGFFCLSFFKTISKVVNYFKRG